MVASYEKINYTIRPAKSIQRKMLCETFRKVSSFHNINDYQYIGFGSTFFSDFSLIHKSLGIETMISIEKDIEKAQRFEFNLPYNCIEMEFGLSNEILPTLNLGKPTILWLDYDGKLSNNILADISLFCASSIPGSIIVITINVKAEDPDFSQVDQPYDHAETINNFRMEKFEERIGEEKIPKDIIGEQLNHKELPSVCRRIIKNEIFESLNDRNGGFEETEKIEFNQLFNFLYKDGAQMFSYGGIINRADQKAMFDRCSFDDLFFVKSGEETFKIKVPSLTFREIQFLDAQLPGMPEEEIVDTQVVEDPDLVGDFLPDEDVEMYAQIYRYFPNFVETEI